MEINTNSTSSNTTAVATSNKENTQPLKSFDQHLKTNEKDESQEYTKSEIERILADIWSLMVNGYSITELEALQKAISEITNLIKEEANVHEIEKLIDDLEKMLMAFQKSVSGSAIKEASENLMSSGDAAPTMEELIFRLEDIKDSLEEAIKGKKDNITAEEEQEKITKLYSSTISKGSSSDELKLLDQLKQTSKENK